MRRILVTAVGFILFTLLVSAPAGALDLSRGVIYDLPAEKLTKQFGVMPVSQLTYEDSVAIASYAFDADTLKVLAILVEWSDRPGTYSVQTFDSLCFSRGVFPGGSIADYYAEVSYGQLTVVGDVIDWYNAGIYNPYFDFESILPALDATVDFSKYDGDYDGNVDGVIFIRSGNGEEDSQDPDDIWSYAMVYPLGSGPGPYDGVRIPRWNTSPETRPLRFWANPTFFTGEDTLNGIRVFAHELTHNLGLPDLYDYDAKLDMNTYITPNDDNDHPLVDWCLMGYYGYGYLAIGSTVPSHLCGWSKSRLGWVEPIVIDETTSDLVLYNIETTPDSSLYMLPINPVDGEYFLLEYRNPRSSSQFDKLDSDFSCYLWPDLTYGNDTLDCGLLITHIHDSLTRTFRVNDGTPTYPHYTVMVEDAGYDPARDYTTNPYGLISDTAQWWYPYETRRAAPFSDDVSGQELFGPATVPNSDGYYGPSGITVQVDSIVGERLYASIEFSTETDADGDGVPNVIDNCPFTYNPDQTDIDTNGIGDECQTLPPFSDVVSTSCTKLIVSSDGNAAFHGTAGLSMDYVDYGDCESIYMYDGTPVIARDLGSGNYVVDQNWLSQSSYRLPVSRKATVPTVNTGDYEIYESGTFVTDDNTIALEKTWYAPQHPDTCNFVIQCLKIYSWDGDAHSGLAVGEAIDWDIPSDVGVNNVGGSDINAKLIYQQGQGFGCINNAYRFGGQSLLAIDTGDGPDTTAQPFGAYTALNSVYLWAVGGYEANDAWVLMQQSGYDPETTASDQHAMMTFFNDLSIGPADTVRVYTAVITVRYATLNTLKNSVSMARQWFEDHINAVPVCACDCHADPQCDGVPDVLDIVQAVGVAFRDAPAIPDPNALCPYETTDVDCNGLTDVIDVVKLVNVVFRGGNPAEQYCDPCAP